MDMQEYIPVTVLCKQYDVELAFISSLREFELIEIVAVDETDCIPVSYLPEAEKLLRLHHELGVNLEGIDVVRHLLQRMHAMQEEMLALKNRLRLYEND